MVLTRLGNFPALETRRPVAKAFSTLPWALALDELAHAKNQTITLGNQPRVLTNFQNELWKTLNTGASVALSAPTSVGNSFVLELYLTSLFDAESQSVAYVVPTRALITQVSSDLAAIFVQHKKRAPEIITVPPKQGLPLPSNAIYVMTQERLHLTMQARLDFSVKKLVVDEAHSISEGARGILLQSVVEQILERNPDMQVLFASPTTRNLDCFGRLFRRPDILPQATRDPTVSQNFLILKRTSSGAVSISSARRTGPPLPISEVPNQFKLRTRIEKLAHLPLLLCRDQPNLIYANGADEAEDIALLLVKQLKKHTPNSRCLALSKLAKESVHPSYILSECVLHGVGFHYANIPTNLRQEVEFAFADGALRYLVCTSTLLQGVNLPAKNIFMLKPTKGQNTPLKPADFWNLAGRAGRLRREFQGNIFLIDYDEWGEQLVQKPRDVEIAPAIQQPSQPLPDN